MKDKTNKITSTTEVKRGKAGKFTEQQIEYLIKWLKDNNVILVDENEIGTVTLPEVDETWFFECLTRVD